jgi:phosphatidylserine/phosphatidylglycerophosphate/cardiolipin synthase-like enzyme
VAWCNCSPDSGDRNRYLRTLQTPCTAQQAVAQNKVILIDGTVITGSFNFTKAAEDNNAQNLLVIQDADLALKYAQHWSVHRQHLVKLIIQYRRKVLGIKAAPNR